MSRRCWSRWTGFYQCGGIWQNIPPPHDLSTSALVLPGNNFNRYDQFWKYNATCGLFAINWVEQSNYCTFYPWLLLPNQMMFLPCWSQVLYTGLFSPFYTCQQLRPVLNLPRFSCVKRDIIWDIAIPKVLNSPTDSEGERGENKNGGKYFSLYSMY